jgi:hypothetical protein
VIGPEAPTRSPQEPKPNYVRPLQIFDPPTPFNLATNRIANKKPTFQETSMSGTQILEMPANDLVGRIFINPNGVGFVVTALTFDAVTGQVIFEIDDINEDTGAPAGVPIGTWSLDGWTIANRL